MCNAMSMERGEVTDSRPGKKYYLIAALLILIGIAGTFYVVYTELVLRDAIQTLIAPGSCEVSFTGAGRYMIYNEYNSTVVVDGKPFSGPSTLVGLKSKLTRKDSGKEIELLSGIGASYTSDFPQQVNGVSLYEFTIEEPGTYQFEAIFTGLDTNQKAVLIVDIHFNDMIVGLLIKVLFLTVVLGNSGMVLAIWTYKKRRYEEFNLWSLLRRK